MSWKLHAMVPVYELNRNTSDKFIGCKFILSRVVYVFLKLGIKYCVCKNQRNCFNCARMIMCRADLMWCSVFAALISNITQLCIESENARIRSFSTTRFSHSNIDSEVIASDKFTLLLIRSVFLHFSVTAKIFTIKQNRNLVTFTCTLRVCVDWYTGQTFAVSTVATLLSQRRWQNWTTD